jgi:CRP-like cAMP-binding protein/CheY-like chemotaxis protein
MDVKPRILVLEDNYLVAETLSELVRGFGCDVVGTVGHLQGAMAFLDRGQVDGAIVDINLGGTMSFPVCEELQRLNVPFVFVSGYDRSVIPEAFTGYRLLSKPVEQDQLKVALAELAGTGQAPREGVAVWLGNELLDRLTPTTLSALQPQLERVALKPGQVLHNARLPISHVHFPVDGLVTLFARDRRNRRLAVGMVGKEGMVGAAEMLSNRSPAISEAIVEMAGEAWRVPAEELAKRLRLHSDLRTSLLAYVHVLIGEVAQTAIVTGHGTIEQRVARWAAAAAARTGRRQLRVTHEQLSQILAVRRSGVTVALHMLEEYGAIKSHRQLVEVIDHARLERAAFA